MAASDWFAKLVGTTKSYFRIGFAGPRLKDVGGGLTVRNPADSADAPVTASKVSVSGNDIDLNSDAAGSGADYKYTFRVPSSGMSAAVLLTLPIDDGTPNQVLATDGNGVLSWASAASTAQDDKIDTTTLVYNSTSPVAMFTTGAADIIDEVEVLVDTAFDATSVSASVGVSGTTSKYVGSTDIDLSTVGTYSVRPGLTAQGAENLIITFVAGAGGTAGSARVLVHYATPA